MCIFHSAKKEKRSQPINIRDTLFGDMPISEWGKDADPETEPWASFMQAREYLDPEDSASAIEALKRITDI